MKELEPGIELHWQQKKVPGPCTGLYYADLTKRAGGPYPDLHRPLAAAGLGCCQNTGVGGVNKMQARAKQIHVLKYVYRLYYKNHCEPRPLLYVASQPPARRNCRLALPVTLTSIDAPDLSECQI